MNKTFKHTWGSEYCTDNLAAYDFMYTNIWEEPFEINEATTVLHVHFTFKPLMARIKISLGLGANETPKKVILETDSNVLPTSGTIDAQENFTASSVTNSIAVPTNRKEFVVGLLPVGIYSTMTVKVMTTDGLTYSDKSFTLAGLKRNHHYTMSVPCNKKTVTITVPDAIDQKYGTHTYQDNGFYTVDSQYDPEGIFNDWYFYQAEIQERQERRRQTQKEPHPAAGSCGLQQRKQRRFRHGSDPVRGFENREGILRGSDQPYKQY